MPEDTVSEKQMKAIRILAVSLAILMASAFSTILFSLANLWSNVLDNVPIQWIVLMTILPVIVYIVFDILFRSTIKRLADYVEFKRNKDRKRPPAKPVAACSWLIAIPKKEELTWMKKKR